MTPCPPSERLQRFLADRLAGPESDAVEVHVETCADCQQALEQLTRNSDRAGPGPGSYGESCGDFLRRLANEPPGRDAYPHNGKHARITSNLAGDLKRPLPGDTTSPYQVDDTPVGRMQLALALGPKAGSSVEIAVLLRKHLFVAMLIGFGFTLMCFALRFWRYDLDKRTVLLVHVPAAVFLAVSTLGVIIVWRLDASSLRRLRVYEIVLYSIGVIYLAWDQYNSFFLTTAWFPQFAQAHAADISLVDRKSVV